MQTGVTAHSITGKPEGRRGPGLIIGIASAVGVGAGLLVYMLAFRQGPTPPAPSAQPAPASATVASPVPPTVAPPVQPSATPVAPASVASAAVPPPADSSTALKPTNKAPPGAGVKAHVPPHQTQTQKPSLPNDGI